MIARTWNLFHGNTSPPGRRSYLREMVELVTADRPAVVCLQEVPVWALDRVGEWAGMRGVGDRARRAHLPWIGRHVASLHLGTFRSGLTGQGNVILFRSDAKLREHKTITLNTNPFCEEQARRLDLDAKLARRWERERRICQVVKLEFPSRQRLLVANLHATSIHADPRLADAELRRAANFVDRQSEVEEVVIFAGDFNITPEQSVTIANLLASKDDHWSPPAPRVWQLDERRYDGKLLSDHAPVEVEVKVALDAA